MKLTRRLTESSTWIVLLSMLATVISAANGDYLVAGLCAVLALDEWSDVRVDARHGSVIAKKDRDITTYQRLLAEILKDPQNPKERNRDD